MTASLILASRSPRRRELLKMLGVDHEVDPSPIEEIQHPGEDPVVFARRMASAKGLERAGAHPGRFVLSADTIVVVDSDVLGKPATPEEAVAMLRRLSGRRHDVVTAVALTRDRETWDAVDRTAVWFRPLDEETITQYVATSEPMDKAGAYGAQGKGAVLIDRIEGDFFSVMGLSLRVVTDLLKQAGVPYRFTR